MDDAHPDLATTPPATDAVWEILRGVIDPELGGDIVELGMVRDVTVSPDGVVRVDVALTIAGCPLRTQLRDDVVARAGAVPGVTDVTVRFAEMTGAERAGVMDRARLAATRRAPETEVPLTTRVLAVASGKGGVGKSSVTANLAAALAAQGRVVGVLDADIGGFSIPRLLGVDGRLGGSDGKIEPLEVVVPGSDGRTGLLKVVSMGFLVDDESSALMWRGLMLSKALEQFLTDVRWGEMDYLLVDMPPGTGDVPMALARLLPRAEVLVVTTPALAAQRVAARVADMARRYHQRVLGVVENMSAFTAGDGVTYHLFGQGGGDDLAERLGVPLVGRIPIEGAVAAGGDAGRPVVLGEPSSASAVELTRIAADLSARLLPPVEMAGCSARLLGDVEARLAALDAARAEA
jgi:ATP-binding protein involved in chromosome partitioning